ncbi:Kringle [Trinorchestia longiramus]|nr:Kringle [Trinorchestia longiramus]
MNKSVFYVVVLLVWGLPQGQASTVAYFATLPSSANDGSVNVTRDPSIEERRRLIRLKARRKWRHKLLLHGQRHVNASDMDVVGGRGAPESYAPAAGGNSADENRDFPEQNAFFNLSGVFNDPYRESAANGLLPGILPGAFDPPVVEPPNLEQGSQAYCQVYRGVTCRGFIGNRSIYIESPRHLADIEKKLAVAINVIVHSNDLTPQCEDYAIKSLCYASLPLCAEDVPVSSTTAPAPRQLCREECEILANDVCKYEYLIAKTHEQIKELPIPECDDLPPITSHKHRSCIRLGVKVEPLLEENEDCYRDSGHKYRGRSAITEDGLPCAPWHQMQLYFRTAEHAELIGGHNFCRNPGNTEDRPWCYVSSDSNMMKKMCAVPVCRDLSWVYIVIASLVGGTVLFVLLLAVLFKRKKSTSPKAPKPKTVELNALLPKQQQQQLLQQQQQQQHLPQIRAREYAISNVRFMQELGEGAFGKVYRGELRVNPTDMNTVAVAVKTLKENATVKTRQDFHREVDLMSELRHPNIVCLVGVVLKEEPMCMIFEHMSQGDLHEFLQQHSPRQDASASSDDGMSTVTLEHSEMLSMATQISAGLEYLASHHFVHRDIASRNCLVGDDLVVKISDFGLSRDIYSSDYYRVQSKSLLPVRWMPPESILYGKFSTESDVWSFGVLLWEIYSYGLQPYYGYSNPEVIELIRSRHLLPCPDNCQPRIYALMVECWHETPHRRPSFREIHQRLRSWSGLEVGAGITGLSISSISGAGGQYAAGGGHFTPGLVNNLNLTSSNLTGSNFTGTLTGSVSGQSGSQHSSTGPSNNTGSTNLSGTTQPPHLPRPYHGGPPYTTMAAGTNNSPNLPSQPPQSPAYSAPYNPNSTPSHTSNGGMYPKMNPPIPPPVNANQTVFLAQRSNAMGGSPVTIRVASNNAPDTQLANL